MKIILAEMTPQIPWPVTGNWVLGLLGALSAVGLILMVYNQAKKAFGRTPPIIDELNSVEKRLRGEIAHAKNSAIKTSRDRIEVLERQFLKFEEHFAEMQRDRIRKWEELLEKQTELSNGISFIKGKLEDMDSK